MKNSKKIVLFVIALLMVFALAPNFVHANTSVGDENSLRTAIEQATNGEVITLSDDIVLTKPIEITGKDITIDGKNFTVTRAKDGWSADGNNATLITAGKIGTKLNLMNINFSGAQKYGVQAYSGAYVILDNVTISNCGYGGVLVNAGTVEIRNLILHKNGDSENNGIEIAKGTGVYDEGVMPKLIMNGAITSSETKNVIYLAVNDQLAEFEVSNTDTSQDKLYISGNKVIVTDAKNNIKFESNENEKPSVRLEGETFVANPVTPKSEPDNIPQTGFDNKLGLAIFVIVVSSLAVIALKKK